LKRPLTRVLYLWVSSETRDGTLSVFATFRCGSNVLLLSEFREHAFLRDVGGAGWGGRGLVGWVLFAVIHGGVGMSFSTYYSAVMIASCLPRAELNRTAPACFIFNLALEPQKPGRRTTAGSVLLSVDHQYELIRQVFLPNSLLLMQSLSSGVYIVQNAHNSTWAVISYINDYSEVISGTDTGNNIGHKVQSMLAC
jgi:hypothetical protein